MSDNKIFEDDVEDTSSSGVVVEQTPDPVPVPAVTKKGKHKKPMSDERKAALREQLVKARAASLAKRQAKAKQKKMQNIKEEEVEMIIGVGHKSGDEAHDEPSEVVVKKPRKKNIRYVEETEQEMETRIEKRIRERMEKEREKQEKENARKKELDDLRAENASLKAAREEKKKQIIEEETQSVKNPIPQFSQFSTFGRNALRKKRRY